MTSRSAWLSMQHDGDYWCSPDTGGMYYGKTLREAMKAARKADSSPCHVHAANYTGEEVVSDRALVEALEEIREVWAGAECGEPVHAQEAYAIHLCKQMYAIAVQALGVASGPALRFNLRFPLRSLTQQTSTTLTPRCCGRPRLSVMTTTKARNLCKWLDWR